MQVHKLVAAAIVSVLGAAVVPPGAAQAAEGGWGPTTNVTVPQRAIYAPDAAMAPTGTATVVWVSDSRGRSAVHRAVRHQDGSWGQPARVPGTRGAREAQIAVAGDGERVLVWVTGGTVKAARQAPGHRWSRPTVLDRSGNPSILFYGLSLAVNPRGRAGAAWQTTWADVPDAGTATQVKAVVGHAGGQWARPRRLSAPGSSANGPEVGIDRAGRVTVAWSQWHGYARGNRLMAASRAVAAPWADSRALTSNRRLGAVQLAVTPSGHVAVAWSTHGGTSDRIRLRRWSEETGWDAPATMPDLSGGVAWMDVGMDASGTVTFAWATRQAGVWAGTQTADGVWARGRVAPAGSVFYGMNLVVNAAGDAVVGWESVRRGEHPVQAAYRASGGGWSAVTSLSAARGDTFGPVLALAGDGDAVAAWTYSRDITTATRIQARWFDAQ